MASFNQAKKCFGENVNIINPRSDPIQWNLNSGLRMMCEAFQSLDSEISRLKRDVAGIENKVRMLR